MAAPKYYQAKSPLILGICTVCGAYVAKRREHTFFHLQLDRIIEDMEKQ